VTAWTEHPKVDATADLYVNLIDADVACATPRDHCNCAVAQAIKRAVGRSDAEAVIFPSVAYVLMPADRMTVRANRGRDAKTGQLAWHRFRIGHTLGRQILSFDETGVAAEGGYRFRAPTPSQTLSAKAQREREAQRPGSRGRIATRAPWLRASRYDVTETTP